MRSSFLFRVSLTFNGRCPYEEREGSGRGHTAMEADAGGVQPHAKDRQEPPRSWKALQRSSPEPQEESLPTLGFGLLASGAVGEDTPAVSGRPAGVMCPSGSFGKGHCTGRYSVTTSRVGPSGSLTPHAVSLPACVAASGEIPGNPRRPGDWVWKAQKPKSPLAPARGGPRGPRLSWAASFDLLSQGEAISVKVRKCGLRSRSEQGGSGEMRRSACDPGVPAPLHLSHSFAFFSKVSSPEVSEASGSPPSHRPLSTPCTCF